jgi:transposase
MKNDTTTLHDERELNNSAGGCKEAKGRQVWKLGLDVDLRQVVVGMQCERGTIGPARKFSREQLLEWVKQKREQGDVVHAVYESGGFGYTLHEELVGAGAHCIVTRPMRLNLERRRKNDRMDARELCVRLSRYLDGHREELKPIRIPNRAEQQRRELGRQREFWKKELRRLENHGRALRIEHEHETLSAGWAGPRKWKHITPQCSDFVRGQLEPLVKQIRATKAQLDRLTQEIEALVGQEKIPVGLGALTVSLIDGEVCNLEAFPPSQSRGQLHWLLPERIHQRRRATLWSNRPTWQQACPGAADRSSLATVEMAAEPARPAEILRETQSWRLTQKENGRGAGSTVGHRSVALENRPGHRC